MSVNEKKKIKIGDIVEYVTQRYKSTGVVGIVMGSYEENRMRVICKSGHEWLLKTDHLRLLGGENTV